MRKTDRFITFILTLVIIGLVIVIGVVGYTIYGEITDNGNITLSLGIDTIFPAIDSNPDKTQNPTEQVGATVGNENIDDKMIYRHLYNQLDINAQIIYSKLYENRENLKTGTYTVEFGNTFSDTLSQNGGDDILKTSYQSAIEALLYENPDIFYLDPTSMYINIEQITKIFGVTYNVYINNGKKMTYLAEGMYSKEDVEKREAEIESVKNKIITQVEGKSNYEKIQLIHNYLIDTIEYDETTLESDIYNIYGALVNQKCVCEGYAKAYQYLLNEVGIENIIAIGIGTNSDNETENHAWNYVKLNDNWYAVDVTWDDPILRGGAKLTNKSRYKYFLKGEKTFYENHVLLEKFTDEGQTFKYPKLSMSDYK